MKQPSKFVRFLLPIIIVSLFIAVFVFLLETKPTTAKKDVEEKIWFVESQKIKIQPHQPIVKLIGQVISRENIEISSTIDADVVKRWVSVGDRVNKNQILLNLDQTKFKLMVSQHQAELNEIKALIKEEKQQYVTNKRLLEKERSLLTISNNAVVRAKTLEKSEMASSSQLDDAKRASLNQQIAIAQRQAAIDTNPIRLQQLEAKFQTVASKLALAKDDLSHTKILSPINGIVTQISLDQAEHVRQGSSLVSLYNHKQLELIALIPEKYLANIAAGMQQHKSLQGWVTLNKKKHAVTLRRRSGVIQAKSAGSYLYFSFDKENSNILLGQTLVVHLALPALNNTIAIPTDAIYGTTSIFVIENQRLKRVPIEWLGETLGANGQLYYLIRSSALASGDIILTSKFANAMDGLKVTIRND
ncbi:MAG TPA: HlyD family efflux transporter periplasmic adaptor subunit [Gammaproteobacteria bacterium]|nr:HlyD family efflux transporter periplasmic adaptor subunit [Gammaproteobacteria bacterium]